MNEVWISWQWLYQDKLAQLDRLTRLISKEMTMLGVPREQWVPFLQERLVEGVAQCTHDVEMEKTKPAKPKREASSLMALRSERRKAHEQIQREEDSG